MTSTHDPATSDDSGRASERLTGSSVVSVAPRERDADSSRDRLSDVSNPPRTLNAFGKVNPRITTEKKTLNSHKLRIYQRNFFPGLFYSFPPGGKTRIKIRH